MSQSGAGVHPPGTPDAVFYVGVDVGTQCARAGLFSASGALQAAASEGVKVVEPEPGLYEEGTDDVWGAVCRAVKSVVGQVPKSQIRGIGFDATCSLAVLDRDFKPLSVSPTEDDRLNVVMWLDHRAEGQAERINGTKHGVLRYTGGAVSPEMEMPKLLWLKENMKEQCWDKAGHFFDLPDFLTWRATGSLTRSLCSVVCKWNYQADGTTQTWDDSFLKQIGLEDLTDNNYARIGSEVRGPGAPCGKGLTSEAATELGLAPGTPVATSIIDAHAGALGTLGCRVEGEPDVPLSSRLAVILGTSACHICVNEKALFVPGVWGPYHEALVPGLWMAEGGQSATGKLMDHVIETHPAYGWVKDEADHRNVHVHDVLDEVLARLGRTSSLASLSSLTSDLHVWPDFHGNRSPVADPTLKGTICGLTLDCGVESLAKLYLATIQSLAYSTRHIISALCNHGHAVQRLYACGGLSKNRLFVQTHTDVTGLPIVVSHTKEPVLLGSAMLAACASGDVVDLQTAMSTMGGSGTTVTPDPSTAKYHEKKYAVFLKMLEHQQEYRKIMSEDS